MDMRQFRNGSYKANPQVFKANVGVGGLVALFPHIIRINHIGQDGLTVTTVADEKPVRLDYERLSWATDNLDNVVFQGKRDYVEGKFRENEFEDQHIGALIYTLAFACYSFWQPENIPVKELPLIQKPGLIIPRPPIRLIETWGRYELLPVHSRLYFPHPFQLAKTLGRPLVVCSNNGPDRVSLDFDLDPWINPGFSFEGATDEFVFYQAYESLRDLRQARIEILRKLLDQVHKEAWAEQSNEFWPPQVNGRTISMLVPKKLAKATLKKTRKIFRVLA